MTLQLVKLAVIWTWRAVCAHPSQLDGCTAAIESWILLSETWPTGSCLVGLFFLPLGGRRVLLIKAGCDRNAGWVRGTDPELYDRPALMRGQGAC